MLRALPLAEILYIDYFQIAYKLLLTPIMPIQLAAARLCLFYSFHRQRYFRRHVPSIGRVILKA